MASPPVPSINFVVTAQGAQQTAPATIWANLVALIAYYVPGYTATLPSSLVEDMCSTGVYNLALMDSACVELINSISPFTANPWLLMQLGQVYGVPQGVEANTSVYVVFSGTVGFQIPQSYLVSDGTYLYQTQEPSVIGAGGSSLPVFCVATLSGAWAVPAGAVTEIVSTIPTGITLTCTNPQDGTPSAGLETEGEYRVRVLEAGLAPSQGTQSLCKSLLAKIPGVQPRLISIKQVNGGGWEVICGGGDPYQIANAILISGLDVSTLVGSAIKITSASLANPCVITTDLFHGLTNGQTGVVIAGALGLTGINGTWTVTTTLGGGITNPNNQFSIAYDASGGPAYTGGGVVTPNPRNITPNINSYPDTYAVPFVNPPEDTVIVQGTWNTTSPNFVSDAAVQQLGAPAIANYINSIPVGAPLNLNAMGAAFVAAVLSLFGNNPALISELIWTISINGVETAPTGSTFLVQGDPESAFFCNASTGVTLTQA